MFVFGALYAAGFHFGMPSAVKSQVKELDTKVREKIATGTTALSISGTAAKGKPIASKTITLKDSTGLSKTTLTGSDGKYTLDVTGMAFPLLLKVADDTTTYFSVANASGTCNIHPFTDLVVRMYFKSSKGVSDVSTAFDSNFSSLGQIPSTEVVNTIKQVVVNLVGSVVDKYGVNPNTYDMFSTPFDADSSGFDKVLEETSIGYDTDFSSAIIRETATNTVINTIAPGANDTTAPSVPSNLVAVGASAGAVQVQWLPSPETDVAGYAIYRDSVKIAVVPYTTYVDGNLSPNTLYSYTVEAVDWAGNKSAKTSAVTATTLTGTDTSAPTAPLNLRANGLSSTEIALQWNACSETDVAGYAIYRDDVKIASILYTTYIDRNLTSGTTYAYKIKAYDYAGNYSNASSAVQATPLAQADTTAPALPTGVSAIATSTSTAVISWTASVSADIAGYSIFRNDAEIAAVTKTTYNDKGLTPNTSYSYKILAYDWSGNKSAKTSAVTVFIPAQSDTTAPSAPANLSATATSSTTVVLLWAVSSASDLAGYAVYRDGAKISQVTDRSYTDNNLTGGTTYIYTVKAYDNSQNYSSASSSATVIMPRPLAQSGTPTISSEYTVALAGDEAVCSRGLAFDGTNYLIAIQGNGTTCDNIIGKLVNQSGSVVKTVDLGANGGAPIVAFDGTKYLMEWENEVGSNDYDAYGQFIDTDGNLSGSAFAMDTVGSRGNDALIYGGGTYLFVYDVEVDSNNSRSKVYCRTISPAGSVGNEIEINSGYGKYWGGVAFDGTNFLIIWTEDVDDYEVRGRFVSTSGSLGTEFSINSSTAPSYNYNFVTFNGTNYLATWLDEVSNGVWVSYSQFVNTSGSLVGGAIQTGNGVFGGDAYLVLNYANQMTSSATIQGIFMDTSGSYTSDLFTIFSPIDAKIPVMGPMIYDGSRFVIALSRGTPGANPYIIDDYLDMSVYLKFITP